MCVGTLCSRYVLLVFRMFSILQHFSDNTKVATIVCIFVMMREFRPVEPFLTSYLTSPPINLSTEDVNEKIYPNSTYASFAFIIVVFLVTDYLRYKPVIILDGITGIVTYMLFLGVPTIPQLVIEEIFYSFLYASDVACFTYLYAKIDDPSQYQKITGYVRASSLIGRFICGIFSQVVISFFMPQKTVLVYSSIAGMVFVTFWTVLIPPVENSIYFHRRVEKGFSAEPSREEDGKAESLNEEKVITIVKSEKLGAVARHLWSDFKWAYLNPYVLKWSAWWSLSLNGYYFVVMYSQVLWQTVADEYGGSQYLMNGAIESSSTITGAISTYLLSKTEFPWPSHGDWVLSVTTLILSGFLLYAYLGTSLWLLYLVYIAYNATFQTMLTIAQSEVAQHLKKDSYALIFGFNNFVSLGIGSLITYFVIEGHAVSFDTRGQFMFYAIYFFVLSVLVLMNAISSSIMKNRPVNISEAI